MIAAIGVTTINLTLGAKWDNCRRRRDSQLIAPLDVPPQTPPPSLK